MVGATSSEGFLFSFVGYTVSTESSYWNHKLNLLCLMTIDHSLRVFWVEKRQTDTRIVCLHTSCKIV